jgi:hypothetical protein
MGPLMLGRGRLWVLGGSGDVSGMEVGAMVRNQKIAVLSGGVVVGAVLLAMAADAVLRSSSPAAPGAYTMPASWMVRGGGEGTAVWRVNGLGRPDQRREDGRADPASR